MLKVTVKLTDPEAECLQQVVSFGWAVSKSDAIRQGLLLLFEQWEIKPITTERISFARMMHPKRRRKPREE